MLDRITPVVLTRNEAPNIGRNLERLRWARDIVVLDSLSDDETVAIARTFPKTRVLQRPFDTLANQWNFALRDGGIRTEWVLALDADYILTDEFVEEVQGLAPDDETSGYSCRFRYCIQGRPLRGSLYPPVTVLFRHAGALYRQDGHTHRVTLQARVRPLTAVLLHDDRKSLKDWLLTQEKHISLEAQKLAVTPAALLSWPDRLRRIPGAAPFAAFFYAWLVKGGVRDGPAGLSYALQRLCAEALLSMKLIEARMGRETRKPGA